MSTTWAAEACDHRYDPNSGALITYLTCSAHTSINIYCEQPYTSPDGNRIAILRKADVSFDPYWSLLVADLTTLKVTMIARGVQDVCNAAWSGLLICSMDDGQLLQVNLETLATEKLALPPKVLPRTATLSVSPDQRYIAFARLVLDTPPIIEIVVLDLETQEQKVVLRHPELVNSHLQFNPIHGRDLMVQHNRGAKMAADGSIEADIGPEGATHFIIDRDGSNQRELACGVPHTSASTGHSNFVADTGRVAWTGTWNLSDGALDPKHPQGNLFTAGPDDLEATVFPAPEHRFTHVNVSRCGRYFICDSMPPSMFDADRVLNNAALVIGNLATGKHRILVSDIGGPSGGGQHTHAHAYLTADNRSVIYNAPTLGGATQVCAARVPDGFLEALG
jgi:hypothetical protein